MRRTSSTAGGRRDGWNLALLCAVCLWAGAAAGQESVALRAQQFQPNADGLGYFTVESARSAQLGKLIFSLHANYATGVLATWNGDELQSWAVRRQLGLDLQLGMGFRVLDLVVMAPFAPYQQGSGLAGTEFSLHPFGDIVVRPKVTILSPDVRRIGLAMALPISFPTGKETAFYGEAGVTVSPTAIAEMRLGPLDVGANLGIVARKKSELLGLTVGTQFAYGLAVRLRPLPALGFQAELWGVAGSRSPAANPANWLAGLNLATRSGFLLRAGIGSGMGPGYGAPKVRVVFGIGVAPPPVADRDRDSFIDQQDRCPGQAEDPDGFEDGDGCPDPDNDGDGIEDVQDGCPDEAETVNEFDDEDGCPDERGEVAADGDDVVGVEADGTRTGAEGDKDGDGIADDVDPCPLHAEDVDGVEDEDGCPEEDLPGQDGDPSGDDGDPGLPGTGIGLDFADGAGIGLDRADGDGDGVADAEDLCPDEPEVVNEFADDDGCPDEVSFTVTTPTVTVDEEQGRLDVSHHIYFDSAAATLRPESFAVLNKVASVLIVRDDIAHIEIQGHTDERGDGARNRQLSQDRADMVRRYLVNLGVEPQRVTAVGYGPDRPLDHGHDETAWSRNRRVEFHIGE